MAFFTSITETILSILVSIHNGLPQGNLSLCINVKVTLFSSQGDILTLPTCEWLQKLTHPFPDVGQARDVLQD